MRGKDTDVCEQRYTNRITPAYAGKRFSDGYGFFSGWDHPRLCGEKLGRIPENSTIQGSPPPMRGKDVVTRLQAVELGITPAYAGKRTDAEIAETVT